ncbi:MAG: hypothetical protein ACI80K_003176 [Paracoccaceae bacterium]
MVHEYQPLRSTRGLGHASPAPIEHPDRIKSRVPAKYKTRYRVTNWREYELGLIQRGDVTIWLSPAALDGWKAQPTGRRGGQPKFSDLAIETALALRCVIEQLG